MSSACIRRRHQIGEFLCSHINIEGGRKSNIFGILYYIISRKIKMSLRHTQKDFCSVWRRLYDWANVSKLVCKVLCWRFLLEDPRLDRSGEVNGFQIKPLIENNQYYAMWGITNTLKISKSNTENHWHQLSYANHFNVWVSHKLSEKTFLIMT